MVQDLAKAVDWLLLTGTVVGILVHAHLDEPAVFAAVDRIHNQRHSVAPSGCLHTADEIFRRLRHVFFFKLCETIRAISAVIIPVLPKIPENIGPETLVGKAVKGHLFQPFPLPFLNQRRRLLIHAFRRFHPINEKLIRHHILSGIKKHTFRRETITTGSSGFLVIAFHIFRHVIVDHIADVGLVDAHAKSVGSHHDLLSVENEILLIFPALLIA